MATTIMNGGKIIEIKTKAPIVLDEGVRNAPNESAKLGSEWMTLPGQENYQPARSL